MVDLSRTEKQKMLAGELYRSTDLQLVEERSRAKRLTRLYNATTEDDLEERSRLLQELFGHLDSGFEIVPPFYCDYGSNIHAGKNLYLNFGCVILDCNTVHLGDNLLCAPSVHIYTAYHPTDPSQRLRDRDLELAAPVTIGNNAWLGGGVIVCPGVTIGDNTTIGAGSVVVKDIPANVIAAGNPCRVIRPVEPPAL